MPALSLVWGLLAFIGMMIGFFPILVFLNWLNLPFAVAGLAVGVVLLARSGPADRAPHFTGIACCALAVAIGVVRLAVANSAI